MSLSLTTVAFRSGQKGKTFSAGISLADATIVPYALAVADLNKDGVPDIAVARPGATSVLYFGRGR